MKKKLVFGILALFFAFVCGLAGSSRALATRSWSTAGQCRSDAGSYASIPAVGEYICDQNYWDSQNNVCAAWLGPVNNSTAASIKVSENDVSLVDGKPSGIVGISLYGMCTDEGHPADHVRIISGDNESISNVPSEFNRGSWLSPREYSGVRLNIGKFVEGLDPIIGADGSTTYIRTVELNRHYKDSPTADDAKPVSIMITIPKLTPTFAAESAVYAGVNSREGQANTERVVGTGQDKVTLDTMAGREPLGVVSEGAEVYAAFVHYTYASEPGATATYGVNLTVEKEGEGRLSSTRIAESMSWTLNGNVIAGSPNLTFGDNQSEGYYLPNNAVSNDAGTINGATEINTYNQIRFRESGSYTICETLTIDTIKTTACVKFVTSNVDSSYAARSDVWSDIQDKHATTTATTTGKSTSIDDTNKVFIFKEIAPETSGDGDGGDGDDASGDGDASGGSGDSDSDSDEPEATYEPESFEFELTFAHTILNSKNFTSSSEEYNISYSGNGFEEERIVIEEDADSFIKGDDCDPQNACETSGSDTASFEPIDFGVTVGETEFNQATDGYFAPSIAEEFEDVPFMVKQKFNVTINFKNDDGDPILSGDETSKDFEFCETLSFRGIETRACEKIRVRLEECDPEVETCESEPQRENTPVVETRARVSIDSFTSQGSATADVTTGSVSSGLAGDWRRDAVASGDATATVRLANNASSQGSARIRIAFDHGVYLASTDPEYDGDVQYTIERELPTNRSGVSISSNTDDETKAFTRLDYTNASQRGFLVKSGTSRSAYHSYAGGNAIWYDGVSIPYNSTNKCMTSYPTGNPPDLKDIELQNDCRFFYTPSTVQGNGISQNIAMLQAREVVLEVSKVGEYRVCETVSAGEGSNAVSATACARVIVTGLDMGECESYAATGYYEIGETHVLSKVKRGNSGDDWWGELDSDLQRAGIVYAIPGETINWLNCYFPGAQAYANASVHKINGSYEGLTERHTPHCGSCTIEHGTKVLGSTTQISSWNNNGVSFGSGFSNEYLVTTTSPSFWNGTPNFNGAKLYYSNGTVTSSQSGIFYGHIGVGSTDIKQATNSRKLTKNQANEAGRGDVGRTYYDEIITQGKPFSSSVSSESDYCDYDCGYKCRSTCRRTSAYNVGNFRVSQKMSTSEVRVPYNYINTTSVEITGPNDVVYAGDTVNVSKSQVKVSPRANSVTGDTYATQIPGGRASLIFYVTEEMPTGDKAEAYQTAKSDTSQRDLVACGGIVPDGRYKSSSFCAEANSNTYGETGSNMLNPSGDHNGEEVNKKADEFRGNYNVFDASAGDWFCAVLAVYPYTVTGDKDIDQLPHGTPKDDTAEVGYEGTKQWYVSAPSCLQIAKKPSFQVLGGSFFSNGSVETNFMRKSNLYGVNDSKYAYSPQGYDSETGTFYSSWVEQSVVTNGTAKWLASGAATGRVSGDARTRGASNKKFCESWVPLSIANITGGTVTGICPGTELTGLANITSKTNNREALVDFWKPTAGLTNANVISAPAIDLTNVTDADGRPIGSLPSPTGRNVYWLETANNISIETNDGRNDIEIAAGQTYILKNTNGSVTIAKNIIYNSGEIKSSASIPKVLIYARGDINILCSVSRIDAILISGEGKVNTCSYDVGGINSDLRDNQLVVNGVIIADTLELPRTYGAAYGNYSGTAAEVVNYDTSSILWGSFMSGAAESNTLVTVFTEELSPRY